ncbi:MAG: hypothetical protein QXN04_09365 [Pyrobaculum sp.]
MGIKLAVGILLIAIGLSTGVWSWLLEPSLSAIPFLGLAIITIGVITVASSLKRTRRPSNKALAAGAVGAAVLTVGIYGLLKELEEKRKRERGEALLKLKQLEAQYMEVRDRLTPEQRKFFEEKIAQYKKQLSA